MQITIERPRHGWLPVSLDISNQQFEFRASSVVNDPPSEFLTVALWIVAPEQPLSDVSPNTNPPSADEDTRGVHFWLEPAWHTLLVQRLDNRTDVRLTFYQNHDGGLFVGPDDFRTSERTLFDRCSVYSFAHMIYAMLASIRHETDSELSTRDWHPSSDLHLQQLANLLPRAL